jgi:predicted TIM-barrel fold metal-dependent hydrolase
MTKPPFPVVDSHAHIFTSAMPLREQPRHRPSYDFTLQDYLATLDAHGIALGVIAAASPWADYNDYTIESVSSSPRLRGTVIVSPSVEKYILEHMKRDGIVGVRLAFIGLSELPDLRSFEYRRLLRRIANLDWHVHVHAEAERLPEVLPPLLASGVKIVIDHLGRVVRRDCPDGAAFRAMVAAVESGRTWIKASGPHRVADAAQVLQLLVKETGDERLVWGSDCPFVGEESRISYAETMEWLRNAIPNPTSQRKVMSDNAMALYGFSQ